MRKTLACMVYEKAKKESHSKKWAVLLNTVERKVRFEDGYVQGWLARHKQRDKKK